MFKSIKNLIGHYLGYAGCGICGDNMWWRINYKHWITVQYKEITGFGGICTNCFLQYLLDDRIQELANDLKFLYEGYSEEDKRLIRKTICEGLVWSGNGQIKIFPKEALSLDYYKNGVPSVIYKYHKNFYKKIVIFTIVNVKEA